MTWGQNFYTRCAKDDLTAMPNLAALRAAIFLLSAKNRWGGGTYVPPRPCAGYNFGLVKGGCFRFPSLLPSQNFLDDALIDGTCIYWAFLNFKWFSIQNINAVFSEGHEVYMFVTWSLHQHDFKPVWRLYRRWTSGRGGTIVRKRRARAHVQMHPTSDLCKPLI